MRERLLRGVSRLVTAHPYLLIVASVVLLVVSAAIAAARLTVRTGRYDLLAPDQPTARRFNRFSADFGIPESLIVCAEGADRGETERFMDELASILARRPDMIEDVFYKTPVDFFRSRGLLFVPEPQLAELTDTLRRNRPVLEAVSARPTFESFIDAATSAQRSQASAMLARLVKGDTSELVGQIRMMRALVDDVAAACAGAPPEKSPWGAMVSFASEMERAGSRIDPYLSTRDGRMLFMFLQVSPEARSREAGRWCVRQVRRIVTGLRQERFPTVRAGLTGAPAMDEEETRMTTRDMTLASIVAFIGVGGICVFGFRELLRPAYGLFTLAVGILATFALTALTIGYLNMITLTITATLVGLGIDFSIHVLDRFEEELRNGAHVEGAIDLVIRRAAPGILTGAMTTALAFYAVMFCRFRGMAQLGFIGGSGIVISCVVTLLVLPALLLVSGRRRGGAAKHRRTDYFRAIVSCFLDRPKTSVGATAVFTLALLAFAPMTRKFNFSLLDLQAGDAESVRYEHEMFSRSDYSPRFAVGFARDMASVKERVKAMEALDTVASVESPVRFVPEGQAAKLKLTAELKELIPPAPAAETSEVDPAALREAVARFRAGLAAGGTGPAALRLAGQAAVADELDALIRDCDALERALARGASAEDRARLGRYQARVFGDLWSKIGLLRSAIPAGPVSLGDLPASLRDRFVGRSGALAYYIAPKGNIWDRAFLKRFIKEIQSVDPEVTGPPVVFYEISLLMLDGYKRAALYALAVIVVVVLLDFRSLSSSALAIMPLVVACLWLAGAMGLIGLRFNLANLVALPLIIGIGVTSGVHMVHRYRQEGCMFEAASGTGHAVFLSLLTTVCGFGSMCIARHHGVRSLGMVLTIGVSACLFNAVVLLPILMNYVLRGHRKPRRPDPGGAGPLP